MKFSYTISEVASICGALRRRGESADAIRGVASLSRAAAGHLSFLGGGKYREQLARSAATAVLVPTDFDGKPRDGQVFLFVENPSRALDRLCAEIENRLWPRPFPGVHSTAVIGEGAIVDSTASIGPLCVIEPGAQIGTLAWLEAGVFVGREAKVGPKCRLHPGARVLANCELGQRVVLHAGTVVGADGFGYDTNEGRHGKIPQVGNVVICDDVEIGANTTIDRARFDSTVIGEGTKIDNLVQIGHNVIIGKHCIICAQAGIAGTTTIEDYVVAGGQVGIGGHLTIGRGAMMGGQTGITSDLPAGAKVRGTPPMPVLAANRFFVLRDKIPDLFKRVEALEALQNLSAADSERAL